MAERMSSPSPDPRSPRRVRTAASYFMDPPSSPPPTSPLPLPPSWPSPISSIRSGTRVDPTQLPRPQTSLPNLRPGPYRQVHCVQGTHQSVRNSSQHVPYLQSPYNSSNQSQSQPQLVRTSPPSDLRASSTDLTDVENLDEIVSRSENDNRIWWSPDTSSPSPPGAMLIEWPHNKGRTAPGSRKRQTRKPPHRAVARTALYIPSQVPFAEPETTTTIVPPLPMRRTQSLQNDELITSLPLLSVIDGETRSQDPKVDSAIHKGKQKALDRLSLALNRVKLVEVKHDLAKSGKRISFCAVTNLEEFYASKESEPTPCPIVDVDTTTPSARQNWHRRHRRCLWIVATILFVLAAAGGILTGVLWRLDRSNM